MGYREFTKAVGAEVGISKYYYGSLSQAQLGIITKINGHGHIFVNVNGRELKFDKNGDSYKNPYGPRLTDPVSLKNEIKFQKQARRVAQIQEGIDKVFRDGSSYSRGFSPTKERIEILKSLVAELEGMLPVEEECL